jgi:hypothetical protein
MKLADLTKIDTIKNQLDEVTRLVEILKDYGCIEITDESDKKNIDIIKGRTSLYLNSIEKSLKDILKRIGFDEFI